MNLHELVSELLFDTTGLSLGRFVPELCLCVTMLAMLVVRMLPGGRRVDVSYVALIGTGLALWMTNPWIHLGGQGEPVEIFTGMLVYDPFTIFMRSVLVGFAFLFVIFTKLSGIPDLEDGPDIYTLILGATLGMCLMASANHLLMIFMAVEMASVPSSVLAGILKGRRVASEAALKYSIYGAGAAGVMLYGISLLAGMFNTAHLPTLAVRMSETLPGMGPGELMVLALAGLMIAVGLAFKLSAVPFHFWCPDVFEGATAEVNAFLSVASKAAALALLVRVALGLGALPPPERYTVPATAPVALVAAAEQSPQPAAAHLERLRPSRDFIGQLIGLLAALTCTFGNLAAYAQTNVKRLLAYSTIAHAGYMMMPVSALMVMVNYDTVAAQSAVSSLAIYIAVYLFMNLTAFAIVAFLRNALRSEEIADYAGLVRRTPVMVICFAITLFSLVGLPPLSGFIGKFAIFAALVDGYQLSATAGQPQPYLIALLVVGGVNTVISLFYYLRIVKVMTFEEEPEERLPFSFSAISLQGAYVCLLTAPTALLIFNWDILNQWAMAAARHLM